MRQPGYYWVKPESVSAFQASFFNGVRWTTFENGMKDDSFFYEINEARILMPDEKFDNAKEILEVYSGLIRYGYQEAIDYINCVIAVNPAYVNKKAYDFLKEILKEMQLTKKEINFEKLKEEFDNPEKFKRPDIPNFNDFANKS